MKTMPTMSASNGEVHISSLVVLCRPEELETAVANIEAMPNTEVHATDATGKIIVVIESPSERKILDAVEDLEAISGVVSATLVYHQID